MSSKFRLCVTTNPDAVTIANRFSKTSPLHFLNSVVNFFAGCVNGSLLSSTIVSTTAVSATGSVTFSAFVNNDTVTVGTTTLTGKTSPTLTTEFAIGLTDAATAINFAACVNANATTQKFASAAQDGTTAQKANITCTVPGLIGNFVALAISAHGSVSASTLANGSEDAPATISHGL